jgi:hypothetical protein
MANVNHDRVDNQTTKTPPTPTFPVTNQTCMNLKDFIEKFILFLIFS